MRRRKGQQLPATLVEHDALEYARKRIAFFRANPVQIFGMTDVYLLGPDAGEVTRRRGIDALKYMASQAQQVEAVVGYARDGWDLAQTACKELLLELKHRCIPLPPALRGYDYSFTAGTLRAPTSGPKPYKTFFRDIAICIVVNEVAQKFGLNPHRSPTAPRPSGIPIVAAAMSMGADAVKEIWRKYGRLINPIYAIA